MCTFEFDDNVTQKSFIFYACILENMVITLLIIKSMFPYRTQKLQSKIKYISHFFPDKKSNKGIIINLWKYHKLLDERSKNSNINSKKSNLRISNKL